jgi:hypothetical protein
MISKSTIVWSRKPAGKNLSGACLISILEVAETQNAVKDIMEFSAANAVTLLAIKPMQEHQETSALNAHLSKVSCSFFSLF